MRCEGDKLHSAYSACSNLRVFERHAAQVELFCQGDSSCHDVDVFADHSGHVVVDVLADYAAYAGDIYTMAVSQGVDDYALEIRCQVRYIVRRCSSNRRGIP